MIARLVAKGGAGLVLVAALFFFGDYAVLRLRGTPTSTVTVYHYLAIQEKNNRQEFVFQGTEEQTCVHSMFPHMSDPPCWYAVKHTEQRQNI
jgi:hypothetical protein